MSETITAANGVQLPIDSLATALGYTAGFVSSLTVVYNGITYVQTITNDGTNITNVSQWEPQ